ncbi:leucine-rich melanocyte differentiation-associated protein-like isoform X2 [Babylonia areolata]|uniref:leucine-rich melanocyte differentiation-associated protein-like isoform X2 n=1 Tax=Babylonia areolata TaxID=304850 RepID=UPI003FD26985
MATHEDSFESDPSPVETQSDCNVPVFTDGQLSFLGHDVEEIPSELVSEFADRTVRLDLSFNRIRRLEGLEQFTSLKELILDNNELGDNTVFPCLKSLTTLFLNKNQFLELEPLLMQLKNCFPQLHYLSLLGNAACPNQLSSTEKDEEDYQRYRYYVLFHLPKLKFLDSSMVQLSELTEARQRGQFMQVVRPTVDREEDDSDELTPQFTPLPTENQNSEDSKHLGQWGKSRSRYRGRNSEGNRFITDMAL